jgi:hypothetical protein
VGVPESSRANILSLTKPSEILPPQTVDVRLFVPMTNRNQEAADQISVGSLSQSDFSDSSADLDFSDDSLSVISDVSSVASFHIAPPQKHR